MRRRALKLAFVVTLVLIMGTGLAVTVLLNLRVAGVDGVQNEEERSLNIARFIARTYDNRPPGSEYFTILYSPRLPDSVRLPTGILESITHASDCDSMVRALIFLAVREGIETRQSGIFVPTIVHSVVEVLIDGRWVLVDPYLGVVFQQPSGTLADFKTTKVTYAALKQDGLCAEDRVANTAKSYYSKRAVSVIAQSGTEIAMPLNHATSRLPETIEVILTPAMRMLSPRLLEVR